MATFPDDNSNKRSKSRSVAYDHLIARGPHTYEASRLTNLSQENYTKAIMPANLTMRVFASSYQTNFEGLYFGDVAELRAALKPLLDQTGLTIQTATTKSWLDGFVHYANAATDPTTPYSMVRCLQA